MLAFISERRDGLPKFIRYRLRLIAITRNLFRECDGPVLSHAL
jgi:hypothetical protein